MTNKKIYAILIVWTGLNLFWLIEGIGLRMGGVFINNFYPLTGGRRNPSDVYVFFTSTVNYDPTEFCLYVGIPFLVVFLKNFLSRK